MNADVQSREGNRCRGYLQGVYPTGDDNWVALCVRDDADRAKMMKAMERSELPHAAHDEFDIAVVEWTRTRTATEIVDVLSAHQVPAERVLTADGMYDIAQLDARGFYQELEHPITGPHRFPGWPFRITPGPVDHHRLPPPTLGQ